MVTLSSVTNSPSNTIKRRCSTTAAFSSSAGNLVSITFGNTLLATTSEFSAFAGQYQEYRTLAIKVHIVPLFTIAGAPIYHTPNFLFTTDRSGVTAAPGSNGAAWRFSDAKLFNSITYTKTFSSYQARAIDITDQLWQPTTTSTDNFRVFLTATADAASTVSGAYYVEYVVEFKGLL
jgi:hypothetical protein